MLNIRELENRWLKYKIKFYIPHTIIALSSIIIAIIIFIVLNPTKQDTTTYTNNSPIVEKNISVKTTPITEIAKKEEPTIIKELVGTDNSIQKPDPTNQENSFKLSPSLDFIKKMQQTSPPYYQDESIVQTKVSQVKKAPVKKEIIEEVQDLDFEEETTVPEEEPKKVTINRRNVTDDIKHIIKRFKKNNNPALSLFVAKKYYELGDYHKAYNYALITNQIDSDIEASWIVFSKSLVKLKEKEMAIKTLKEYIESSHSSSAQILLDEIQSGKFK